jgi:superfamily II DNA or RNA helicase
MAQIIVNNSTSRLLADRGVISDIRRLVAYREIELPPPPAQAIIKSFFMRRKRHGPYKDIERLYADLDTHRQLEAVGCPYGYLSPDMLEQVLRQRGTWDGWIRMVGADGGFQTGLLPHVVRALRLRLGITADVFDERVAPPTAAFSIVPVPPLYDFQKEALVAFLEHGRGIVELPPRSGKTHIAIAVIIRLSVPTLYVVPTVGIARQTVEAMRRYMPHGDVMQLTGGAPTAKRKRIMAGTRVWVVTPPTAAGPRPQRKGQHRRGITGIGSRHLLIIDEFHHSAANTWQDISLSANNAYYRLGLTGTNYRADGKDMLMRSVVSRTVYRRSVSDMIAASRLVPAFVAMLRVPGRVDDRGFRTYYVNGVVENDARNQLIAQSCAKLVAAGRRVLVLVKEIKHAERLYEITANSVQVDGRNHQAVAEAIAAMQSGKVKVIIGTSVIGEGIDVPAADALIYAAAGRSKVKVVQDFYRVLTANEGKKFGVIVDFADNHNEALLKQAAHRLDLYRREFQADVMQPTQFDSWLHGLG